MSSAAPPTGRLRRELTLPGVFAVATGVTMSSGFFLLPGIAFGHAGPAVILAYVLAALPLIPGVLCMAELATAMPRAGGVYFFIDRTMGPLPGTIAGFGTWLALVFKAAFALVGIGAYLKLYLPTVSFQWIAAVLALLIGVLNWLGARKTGTVQIAVVVVVLAALSWFCIAGLPAMDASHFAGFFSRGWDAIWSTAALVCVSYVGITKIASISEEIRRPERTIPLGMFLALVTAVVIFAGGITVMVGVLPGAELAGSLTPVADAARAAFGGWAAVLLSGVAMLAFVSVANAAVLSASRYPLAMARDHLVPRGLRYVGRHRTPTVAIAVTVALTALSVLAFDPTRIAELASSFQLLLFAASCVAVLVMRESRILSYDPGYRSPLYPWLQVAGVVAPLWFISQMGVVPILFCSGLILLGVVWYFQYARHRVVRAGAVHHVFERWGRRRYDGIDTELREIMKEKGLRDEDPFDDVVAGAEVLDLGRFISFERVVAEASLALSRRTGVPAAELASDFLEGTRVGATPVAYGVALPHLRTSRIRRPALVMVRTPAGLTAAADDDVWGEHPPAEPIYALFFLASPEADPAQHLRLLAHIAGRVDDQDFLEQWLAAEDLQELKEVLLRDERYLHLDLQPTLRSAPLIGTPLRELSLPRTSLVAIVHRDGANFVPDGDTVLAAGDRITVIGEPRAIRVLASRYSEQEALFPVPDTRE